ncbi:MAG: hypothetical protein MZV64_27880 [Ignavibacteriales bacterium]|nr:hypothetical protein [Ignavibacteriales bacterium]
MRPPPRPADPIRIGAIFSVTGPGLVPGRAGAQHGEDAGGGPQQGRRPPWAGRSRSSSTTTRATRPRRVTAVDRAPQARPGGRPSSGPSTSGSTLAIVPEGRGGQDPPGLVRGRQEDRGAGPKRWVFKVAASDILAVKKIFTDLKQRGLTKSRHPHRLGCLRGRRAGGHQGALPPGRGSPWLPTRCSAPRTPT